MNNAAHLLAQKKIRKNNKIRRKRELAKKLKYAKRCCNYLKMKYGYGDNNPDTPKLITDRNDPEHLLTKTDNIIADLVALGFIQNITYSEDFDLPKMFNVDKEDDIVEGEEIVYRSDDGFNRLWEKYPDEIIRIAHIYKWYEMDFPEVTTPGKNSDIVGVWASYFEGREERFEHYKNIPDTEYTEYSDTEYTKYSDTEYSDTEYTEYTKYSDTKYSDTKYSDTEYSDADINDGPVETSFVTILLHGENISDLDPEWKCSKDIITFENKVGFSIDTTMDNVRFHNVHKDYVW